MSSGGAQAVAPDWPATEHGAGRFKAIPPRNGVDGQQWEWLGPWAGDAAATASAASASDSLGWEYTSRGGDSLRAALLGKEVSGETWVGGETSGTAFRRRCWQRTQRQFLDATARRAAEIQKVMQAKHMGVAALQDFCSGEDGKGGLNCLPPNPRFASNR